jgi:hypothetical protein
VLTKVARWDPDKRWIMAVETVAALKARGHDSVLIAVGGVERHCRLPKPTIVVSPLSTTPSTVLRASSGPPSARPSM